MRANADQSESCKCGQQVGQCVALITLNVALPALRTLHSLSQNFRRHLALHALRGLHLAGNECHR